MIDKEQMLEALRAIIVTESDPENPHVTPQPPFIVDVDVSEDERGVSVEFLLKHELRFPSAKYNLKAALEASNFVRAVS